MKIFVGSDYRGFKLKQEILKFLANKDFEVVDKGAYEYIDGDDFNDAAISVAEAVRDNFGSAGILICDSAHGVTMQANRFKRVRAAHCDNIESAKLAREHDDANILCLSAHFINEKEAQDIIEAFLNTNFTNLERRVRRINRLDEREYYD